MEASETEEYKGYTIEIYQDEFCESPKAWGDNHLFLVAYHRDFYVENDKIITKEEAIKLVREPNSKFAREFKKKYYVFGLEAYIHSGVVLALSNEGNFCDRQWDVSQLGEVFVSKEEWKSKESAIKAARGLIETWNQYLSGDIYGYKILKGDEEIDSCWGYYGDGALAEAKNIIDGYTKGGKDHTGQYLIEDYVKKLHTTESLT